MSHKNASQVVERLTDGSSQFVTPVTYHRRIADLTLKESPQYYNSEIRYQRDVLFPPVTPSNLASYTILGQDDVAVYAVDPGQTAGYVFDVESYKTPSRLGILPVMSASLRDSGVDGLKQVHRLRIRQAYARRGLATTWYILYVQRFGGIVSDFEHLEGGKKLWRSFVDTAEQRGLKITLVNVETGQRKPVDKNTPDSDIWSLDRSYRNLVLLLTAT